VFSAAVSPGLDEAGRARAWSGSRFGDERERAAEEQPSERVAGQARDRATFAAIDTPSSWIDPSRAFLDTEGSLRNVAALR